MHTEIALEPNTVLTFNMSFVAGWRLSPPSFPGPEHVPPSVRRGSRRALAETPPRLQRTLGPLHHRDGPHIPRHRQVLQGDRNVRRRVYRHQ